MASVADDNETAIAAITTLGAKILALKMVNQDIVDRLERARDTEVPQFQFRIAHRMPLLVDMFEWNQPVASVIDAWHNPHNRQMQPITDESSQSFTLSFPSLSTIKCYNDLIRLNGEVWSASERVIECLKAAKAVPYLNAILHNMEIIQVSLGEIETSVFHPDNDVLFVTNKISMINEALNLIVHMPNVLKTTRLHLPPEVDAHSALVIAEKSSSTQIIWTKPSSWNMNSLRFSCVEKFETGVAMWRVRLSGDGWFAIGVHCNPHGPSAKVVWLIDDDGFYGVGMRSSDVGIYANGSYDACKRDNTSSSQTAFDEMDDECVATLNCINHTFSVERWSEKFTVTLPRNKTWTPHFAFEPGMLTLLHNKQNR